MKLPKDNELMQIFLENTATITGIDDIDRYVLHAYANTYLNFAKMETYTDSCSVTVINKRFFKKAKRLRLNLVTDKDGNLRIATAYVQYHGYRRHLYCMVGLRYIIKN